MHWSFGQGAVNASWDFKENTNTCQIERNKVQQVLHNLKAHPVWAIGLWKAFQETLANLTTQGSRIGETNERAHGKDLQMV